MRQYCIAWPHSVDFLNFCNFCLAQMKGKAATSQNAIKIPNWSAPVIIMIDFQQILAKLRVIQDSIISMHGIQLELSWKQDQSTTKILHKNTATWIWLEITTLCFFKWGQKVASVFVKRFALQVLWTTCVMSFNGGHEGKGSIVQQCTVERLRKHLLLPRPPATRA